MKFGVGSRVIVMPDKGGVGDALARQLKALGVDVLRFNPRSIISIEPDAMEKRIKSWLAAGPVQGVYWLPALDSEGRLDEMNLDGWHSALRLRVKSLFTTMRVLYEQISKTNTFLVSAPRLGGQHRSDLAGATSPLGGAVVGFTTTYKRERVDALVKAVDFDETQTPSEVAKILIDETLRDPGAVGIGYRRGNRWTVGLQEQPADDGAAGLRLIVIRYSLSLGRQEASCRPSRLIWRRLQVANSISSTWPRSRRQRTQI